MNMDKSWIGMDRLSPEYLVGVEKFLNFAKENSETGDILRYPCVKCRNLAFYPSNTVRQHLYRKDFDKSYIVWQWHGNKIELVTETKNIGENAFRHCDDRCEAVDMVHDVFKHCVDDPVALKLLLEDAEKPLYPNSEKYTRLSALVKLYNLKRKYGWSDSSFSDLLSLLVDILSENNTLLKSTYEAKKTMSALGLDYEKIHACPNDCVLYRKEFADLSECPTCGLSRWKKKGDSKDKFRKGIPAKLLWYFPPIPRFQRLFQSPEIAKDLTWHTNQREVDGKLRHPADSPAWKLVDDKWPEFASESRNLCLALSADGINPHSSLSTTYSCWPVLLVTYNLPPWLCMKRKFMMLSLLISGPQQPGNDIDVYLAPLVEDLKSLWDVGVDAYDAHRIEFFKLHVVLLWTINDFPAYGNLSGCTVKGYYACP